MHKVLLFLVCACADRLVAVGVGVEHALLFPPPLRTFPSPVPLPAELLPRPASLPVPSLAISGVRFPPAAALASLLPFLASSSPLSSSSSLPPFWAERGSGESKTDTVATMQAVVLMALPKHEANSWCGAVLSFSPSSAPQSGLGRRGPPGDRMKTNRIKNNNAVLTWGGHQSFHCVFVIFVFVVILFDRPTLMISAGPCCRTLQISSNNTHPS